LASASTKTCVFNSRFDKSFIRPINKSSAVTWSDQNFTNYGINNALSFWWSIWPPSASNTLYPLYSGDAAPAHRIDNLNVSQQRQPGVGLISEISILRSPLAGKATFR
jgi:hypothetical protein